DAARLDRPFDVLRPDVAAVDDDQVLGAARHDDLSVEGVAEIAGVEPTVRRQHFTRCLGLTEVARHDAGALNEDPADLAVRQDTTVFAAHFQPMARQHSTTQHEAPRTMAVRWIGRGLGSLVIGQRRTIDGIDAHAPAVRAEGDGKAYFGHA